MPDTPCIGVDDLNDAYDVRLKEWRLGRLRSREGFEFVQCDINDREKLRPVFARGVEGVYNLAARAGVRQSVENPWIYVETNMTGTVTLLEFCREFGVRNFLMASTSSLYGAHNPQPFREDADTNRPLSPYAASKKGAEAMCHTYHHLYGINVTIPRYFTVYGPAGRPDMSLFRFVQWIMEGTACRDLRRWVTVQGLYVRGGHRARDHRGIRRSGIHHHEPRLGHAGCAGGCYRADRTADGKESATRSIVRCTRRM